MNRPYNMGMTNTDPQAITMAFVVDRTIEIYLRERASKEDRSISAVIRRILEAEINREKAAVKEPADVA